jgi:hypothetical protein
MLKNFLSLVSCLLLLPYTLLAQLPPSHSYDEGTYTVRSQDTTYKHHKYNLVEYYETGEVKGLVNVAADSVANGKCIFFRKDGSIIAKGEFKKDIAKGKWKYYNRHNLKVRSYNWNWSKGFKPSTNIIIEDGEEKIFQFIFWEHGRFRCFYDGKYMGGGSFA